jgi:hypothetical protein
VCLGNAGDVENLERRHSVDCAVLNKRQPCPRLRCVEPFAHSGPTRLEFGDSLETGPDVSLAERVPFIKALILRQGFLFANVAL